MTVHRDRVGPDEQTRATEDDVVAMLERWQQFGGTWRVTRYAAGQVAISLCRCDGGEEQEQIVSDDPSVLAWLDGRIVSTP